jgi:hypothetical protein
MIRSLQPWSPDTKRHAGIKKRNHKMLDYDSMRSKVKRLVEKPDKDPSKLPRAEKEADMVGSISEHNIIFVILSRRRRIYLESDNLSCSQTEFNGVRR